MPGVVIEREHLVVDVCNEQVYPSVLIVIARVHSHTRACPSKGTESDAGKCSDVIEPALPAIDEQRIGNRIVADEEVHPPVIVNVRSNHSPSLRQGSGDTGLLADVGESPAAIIMQDPARQELIQDWVAVP